LRKKKHWHIDYLLEKGKIKTIILVQEKCRERLECKLAEYFSQKYEIPLKKFGATDCKCEGHLFRI